MRRTPPPAPAKGRRVEDAEPVLQDLERVLEGARQTLSDKNAQEADLQDRLYELRRANDQADPFWLVIDISRSTAYTVAIREARDGLLARAKALNPQLTTWEKAIDPTWKVSEISTRAGKRSVRPFTPPLLLLKVLQGAGAAPQSSGQEENPEAVERASSRESQDSRSALQVPVEPEMAADMHTERVNQPPVGTESRRSRAETPTEPVLTREMLVDIQETVAGMKRFLSRMEERERC